MLSDLRSFFRAKRFFWIPSLFGILLGFVWSMVYTQVQMSLWVNGHYNAFADTFFYYVTYLGDGLTFLFVIVLLFFIHRKKALCALALFVVPAFIAQILKRIFFKGFLRPSMLIDRSQLHVVHNLTLERWHSFPSGHAVVSFSMALFFVLLTKNKYLHFVFFLLASLVAYSRIFLAQHFVRDVIFGALIALVVGVFVALVLNKKLRIW